MIKTVIRDQKEAEIRKLKAELQRIDSKNNNHPSSPPLPFYLSLLHLLACTSISIHPPLMEDLNTTQNTLV